MKRALLIGSPLIGNKDHELHGVANDLNSMTSVLGDKWAFDEITRCEGADATRAGILDALRELIGRASRKDVAVIYYSGHGGRAREVDLGEKRYRNAKPLPEFIVPTDIMESAEGDFRGITSLELSMFATELWQKTRNVTTIMDCCHSGIMVRGPGPKRGEKKKRPTLKARFLPDCSSGIASHLAELKRNKEHMALVEHGKGARIVRVSACTPAQVAFETENEQGKIAGILTDSLQGELERVHGESLSWRYVGDQISSVVRRRRLARRQNPSISGPIDRLVFGLHTQTTQGVAAIYYDKRETRDSRAKRTVCLQAGYLVGVCKGDEYTIMPPHKPFSPDEDRRATATVVDVFAEYSNLEISDKKDSKEVLISSSPARLVKSNRQKSPVALNVSEESGRGLRQALAKSMHVGEAGPGDEKSAIAEVDEQEDGFVLSIKHPPLEQESGKKPMWAKPWPNTAEGIQALVGDLERWAHARMLMDLGGKNASQSFAPKAIIEWGRVVDGKGHLCEGKNVTLYQNDNLYVRLHNKGSQHIYASVFHVGLTGDIALLTSVSGAGIELDPGKEWLVGQRYSRLKGQPLGWPDDAADDGPRIEHLVAVFSDRPLDLRVFETAEPKERRVRDVIAGRKGRDKLRYRVERIDYHLSPERRPGGDAKPK